MAYIGKEPLAGNFVKLDAITTSATATYALTRSSVAFKPANAESLLVSLNGVTQAPLDAYTVNDTNIVFASALTSSDTIDYILALGEIGAVTTPADSTVDTNKLTTGAVTAAKLATDSVTTIKIADDAVTGAKIENNPTIAGNLTVSGNMVGTITTVAQPNITSVGTLTGLTITDGSTVPSPAGGTVEGPVKVVTTEIDSTNLWDDINANGNNYTPMPSEISIQNVGNNTTNSFAGIFMLAGETSNNLGMNAARIGAIREGAKATSLAFAARESGGDMAEKMRITSSGNVGIGTTSPSAPLQIVGEGNTGQRVHVGSSSAHQIYLGNTGGTSSVGTLSNHDFQLITNGSGRLTVGTNGNVGIGASPESAVKLEVNAGSDGAVAISGRSDGGNGNNRRFNIIPFSSNGTYGGGLRLQTRNTSNVFHTAVEYISNQQEIFHGNYRTCDDKNKFGNGRYWYTGTESGTFSNAGNGVANAQTMTNYLNYQGMQIVCVKVYYNSDSALMHETFATVCNQYHNSGVATQHSHNGTGTIDSVSLSLTGSYNTRRLVVTLDPQASYPASNFTYSVTYGYNLN